MFMSGMVFRLNGEGKRFNGPKMELCNIFSVTLFDLDLSLLRFKTPEIKTIRAIDPINQRQNHERGLPASVLT